jgi:Ser/Thr protein kinase RdoA (MazF antagonist)
MEPRIKERFHAGILEEARRRYRIDPAQLKALDGFESFIYAFERADGVFILRLGHDLRRALPQVMGELDWLDFLAGSNARVATPIRSETGRLVEPIDDGYGGQFVAAAFTYAAGHSPGRDDWTPKLVMHYGAVLGHMHALSRNYLPSNASWRRPDWNDSSMLFARQWLPAADGIILDHYETLLSRLESLPLNEAAYGLIHQDAHAGNLHVDDAGNITLFDFDDCVYSWYANDIAIVLFYAAMWQQDQAAFTTWFMKHFLAGYRRHNRLDPDWLSEFPHFLKLREIDLYAAIHRSFDVATVDDPWIAGFMNERRERLAGSTPTIAFDFQSLRPFL